MINCRTALLFSSGIAALLANAPALAAQEAVAAAAQATEAAPAPDAQEGDGELIVVTAQKREQVLIDVPQSITVVGEETLERNQAKNFQDYLKLVPGLQLTQSTPGQGRLVLRGINTGGVASTVAVYVDETTFGSSSGLVNGAILAGDFDTFDVDRIEVLRGPQGTLYGASSLGGVLKFVTNEPRTQGLEARGRVAIETVDDGDLSYFGSALVNVPVSDDIAVRASGYYRSIGGFVDSIGTGGSDHDKNFNDSISYGGRASLLVRPSDQFSVRFTAYLQDLKSDGSNTVDADLVTTKTLYGDLTQSKFVAEHTDVKYRVYNATATYDFGFADLTSVTSYGKLDQGFRLDATTQFAPLILGLLGLDSEVFQDQTTRVTRITQEIRLTSPASDKFEWLVGGYYTNEDGLIDQHIVAAAPGEFDPILFLGFLPVDGFAKVKSDYKELAGFANATVYFGDHFDLSFGGRYSSNKQKAAQTSSGLLAGATDFEVKSDEDVFTFSVAPKYKFNEHLSLYARVAKGFRPGGPNVIPPSAPAGTPSTYASDSLISYELGLKGETEDRRFSWDLAAFHIDWKDIQLFAAVNGFGVNTNAGKARSNGLEATFTARPVRGLSLAANAAYTDAKLQEDAPAIVGGRDGDRLPGTPKFSAGFNADYEWSLSDTIDAYVGGSLRVLSKTPAEFDPAFVAVHGDQRDLSSYEVLDLRAGLDFGRFLVEAYAKNLNNSEGKTSFGAGNTPLGEGNAGIIRPRAFGLSLTAGL
jgi:outer membrane receptor protein involved in Fe transport